MPPQMRNPAEETPTNKVDDINDTNKSYQGEDADILLVSSDGLKFRVHKWALMASSRVFRNMLEAGTDKEQSIIELTDEKIEISDIIRLYLDLSYGQSPSIPSVSETSQDICADLIKFLHKYDATYPISTLAYVLRLEPLKCRGGPLALFKYGAQLDNVEICRTASISAHDFYREESEVTAAPKKHPLDLTAASLEDFQSIPDKYKYALLRASAKLIGREGSSNWAQRTEVAYVEWFLQQFKISQEFEEVVTGTFITQGPETSREYLHYTFSYLSKAK